MVVSNPQAAQGDGALCILVRYDALTDAVPHITRQAQMLAAADGLVRIVCANPVSADRLARIFADTTNVNVLTAQQLALSVFSDSRICAATKREPRLLDRNEFDVLLEDLKVSGLKPRRLREMLKFLLKGLADGQAGEAGWLVNEHEQTLFALLEENMDVRGALLREEVAYRALAGIACVPDALVRTAVVAEDFGALSKTAQQLVSAASNGRMVVFACNTPGISADEAYPHPNGAAQWAAAHDAKIIELACAHAAASMRFHTLATPRAEFAYVADAVCALTKQPTDSDDVLVAVPNGVWMREVCRALTERVVPFACAAGQHKVKGDPRTPEGCGAVKEAAFAKLTRNRHDITALRTYLGCGDWLMCSDAFLELMAWAREHGMTVADALATLHHDGELAATMKLFDKLEPRLAELDKRLSCIDPQLCAVPTIAESANEASVTVALYEQCHARHAVHVILAGAVDGFIPKRDALSDGETIDHKKRALARDRALFDDILSAAGKDVLITSFETDCLVNTQGLPMEIERIYIKNGVRRVRCIPCQFIA